MFLFYFLFSPNILLLYFGVQMIVPSAVMFMFQRHGFTCRADAVEPEAESDVVRSREKRSAVCNAWTQWDDYPCVTCRGCGRRRRVCRDE